MANQHVKMRSTSSVTRKTQSKTAERLHYIPKSVAEVTEAAHRMWRSCQGAWNGTTTMEISLGVS